MHKRKVVVVLSIVLIGLIIYSEKVSSIGIVENVKRALNEVGKSSDTYSNVTTVDVTGINLGKETQHEHVYKTMYDENKHWEECTVCGEKRSERSHALTITWTSGYESCYEANYYIKTCKCGYSEKGRQPCIWEGEYITDAFLHLKKCAVCGYGIINKEYYYDGKLYYSDNNYENTYYGWLHCIDMYGNKLSCNNFGECVECGAVYTERYHTLEANIKNGKIHCVLCNEEFGEIIEDTLISPENQLGTYKMVDKIKLKNGASFYTEGGILNIDDAFEIVEQYIEDMNDEATEITLVTEMVFNSTYKSKYNQMMYFDTIIDDQICRVNITSNENFSPDLTKPTIEIALSNDDTMTEWSKSKKITISGIENYCNTIKVEILDDEENIIFLGETTVKNGKYSISCVPELEADEIGRKFYVKVTDTCENIQEQEFTISKIDAIAPEVTSADKVNDEWAKEKYVAFIATDYGIGNIQIAFNDISDYGLATKNGTEYSREYKLTGDVYSPREANVYYKDELGNVSTKAITIDQLDNTAPTIMGASFSNDKLNVTAHDRHETEGEGSGISKYRFMTSTTKLENPEVTLDNSIEVLVNENMIVPDIYKVKYVYVVAEDLVRKCK